MMAAVVVVLVVLVVVEAEAKLGKRDLWSFAKS